MDFSKKKAQLRYEFTGKDGKACKQRAARLSSFAYQKLIEAIMTRAPKVGVEIRLVDLSWTSIVGWAKYGSRLGLNADQAAAFTIARRGVLSKGKNIKRAKRSSEWVDLYAKPEKIEGLKSSVGVVIKKVDVSPTVKVVNKKKVSKKVDVSKTQNHNPAQQSMSGVKWTSGNAGACNSRLVDTAERRLSLILGVERTLWATKLKAKRLNKRKISQQNNDSVETTESLFSQESG